MALYGGFRAPESVWFCPLESVSLEFVSVFGPFSLFVGGCEAGVRAGVRCCACGSVSGSAIQASRATVLL